MNLLGKAVILSAFCLCLPRVALADSPVNPLQAPANSTASYQGLFGDGQLRLELQAQAPYYMGTIEFNGQQYPLQAQAQEDGLSGYFQDLQGNRFAFSAQYEGAVLSFTTDNRRFQLQPLATQPPNPLTPPLAGAGLNGNSAPLLIQPTPQFIPQTPQATLSEFHSLNTQIGYDFQLFLTRLRQWLSDAVEPEQSKALLTQQLLPTALQLQHKLAHLGVLTSQMGSLMQLNPEETKLMRQFVALSSKGSRFFEQWYLLFKYMLELHDKGDQQGLYQVAQEQLPGAVKNAIAFARTFVTLMHAADALQYRPLDAPQVVIEGQPSLNPRQMFKWETLRNMSQMMRDAMRMMSAGAR